MLFDSSQTNLYQMLVQLQSSKQIGDCDPTLWHTFNSKAFVLAPSSWILWNPNSELQVVDRHTGGSKLLGSKQIYLTQRMKTNSRKDADERVRTTYNLTCQFRPSSVFLALLASESLLQFQSLFLTPFSPRHYQQRQDSGQRQRLRAILRSISWKGNWKTNWFEQRRQNAIPCKVLHPYPGLKRGVTYFLPNPQENDPFKSSTLLIVYRNTACAPEQFIH